MPLTEIECWLAAHGESAQVVLFLSLFAFFALVERVAPHQPPAPGQGRRWRTNLTLTALNIAAMALVPVTILGAALWAHRRGWGWLNQIDATAQWWWTLPAGLLGRAFISFFVHYLHHHVPWLWRVHRVHHLDPELDVSTTVRFHPLEFLTGAVPGAALALLMGLQPWVLLLYEVLDAGVTVFSHANLQLPPRAEALLRRLIVTPGLHRVHHSAHQPETDSNFGAVFPIWDMLLGTYRVEIAPREGGPMLGLAEVRDQRATQLGWLLASPRLRNLTPLAKPLGSKAARRHPRPPAVALGLLAIVTALYAAIPPLRAPAWPPQPVVASAVLGTGLLLMLWAWAVFRRHRTAVCPSEKSTRLVASGPYRFTRNPMYFGLALMLLWPAIATAAPIFATAPAAFFLLMDRWQVPGEEARLRARFGDDYESYARRVRRWL